MERVQLVAQKQFGFIVILGCVPHGINLELVADMGCGSVHVVVDQHDQLFTGTSASNVVVTELRSAV